MPRRFQFVHNGTWYQRDFPDGMSEADIQQAIKDSKQHITESYQNRPLLAMASGMGKTASFGIGDMLMAAMAAAGPRPPGGGSVSMWDPGQTFQSATGQNLARARAVGANVRHANPAAAEQGDILGAMLGMVGLGAGARALGSAVSAASPEAAAAASRVAGLIPKTGVAGVLARIAGSGATAAGYTAAQNLSDTGKPGNLTMPFLFGSGLGLAGEVLPRAILGAYSKLQSRGGKVFDSLLADIKNGGYDLSTKLGLQRLTDDLTHGNAPASIADKLLPGSLNKTYARAAANPQGAAALNAATRTYAARTAAAPDRAANIVAETMGPTTPPAPTANKVGLFTTATGNPKFLPTDTYSHDLLGTPVADELLQPTRDAYTAKWENARVYGDPPESMPHHQNASDPHTIEQVDQLRQDLEARARKFENNPNVSDVVTAQARQQADQFREQLKIDVPGYGKYLDQEAADVAGVARAADAKNVLDKLRAGGVVTRGPPELLARAAGERGVTGSPLPPTITPAPGPDPSNVSWTRPWSPIHYVGQLISNQSQNATAAASIPALTSTDTPTVMKVVNDLFAKGESNAARALAATSAVQNAAHQAAVQAGQYVIDKTRPDPTTLVAPPPPNPAGNTP
jgi:hypothetical protein